MTHTATLAIYVPQDSLAIALGADDMAASIQQWAKHQSVPVQIIRNGSRGLFWLEPLIEIEIRQTKQPIHSHNLVGANSLKKRIAYGPMCLAELKRLLQIPNWYLGLKTHALFLGPIEKHPYLANQERLSFSRIGLFEPTNLKAYQQHHGLAGLEQALALSPQQVIEKITESGLRGRGGAAFPTGIKWQTVANAPKKQKYIICNAGEGDAGGFSDRLIMEADPFSLIEGMLIAAWAVGANKGVIYLRSEYPNSELILTKAIQLAYQNNLLGKNILGSRFHFDLSLFKGAGSYICGEETALLESMEGKTGLVRAKPPLPAHRGYLGCPTVVNNVVTLATVPT